MKNPGRYTTHLDVLIALITYLALTASKSRTARNLAVDLSLPTEKVAAAFDAFPGIFRKSKTTSEGGDHFYTLHARYALRGAADDVLPEMQSDMLKMLLDFVSQRAAVEAEEQQFRGTLNQARIGAVIAAFAAIVAAVATIVTA